MRARLHDLTFSRSGKQIVSFELDDDFREKFDELKDTPLTVEVKRYRPKRSKNANDYLWTLCTKIAENQRVSPEEVYRKEIREAGVCTAFSVLSHAYERFAECWSAKGIGWFTEISGRDGSAIYFLAYHGSSNYNTAEMHRLIENTITDAKALGIETATAAELSLLMDDWKNKKGE